MKPIVMGAAAFVLGLAGGTGIRVAVAPPPKNAPFTADSLKVGEPAPSSAVQTAVADSQGARSATSAGSVGPATSTPQAAAPTPPGTPSAAPSSQEAAQTRPAATAAPAPGSATEASGGTYDPREYKVLARILVNMKASDAAKIMSYMTDEQVQGLIRAMGVRQAADLLSKLPTERAANLSQGLIEKPSPTAGGK